MFIINFYFACSKYFLIKVKKFNACTSGFIFLMATSTFFLFVIVPQEVQIQLFLLVSETKNKHPAPFFNGQTDCECVKTCLINLSLFAFLSFIARMFLSFTDNT